MDREEQQEFLEDPEVERAILKTALQFEELEKICQAKGWQISLFFHAGKQVSWTLQKIREENNADL